MYINSNCFSNSLARVCPRARLIPSLWSPNFGRVCMLTFSSLLLIPFSTVHLTSSLGNQQPEHLVPKRAKRYNRQNGRRYLQIMYLIRMQDPEYIFKTTTIHNKKTNSPNSKIGKGSNRYFSR